MSVSRRGLLRGGVGAVGAVALTKAAKNIPTGHTAVNPSVFGGELFDTPSIDYVSSVRPSGLRKGWGKLYKKLSKERSKNLMCRIDGLDADLWSLNSLPLTRRMKIQAIRDEKAQSVLEKIHEKIYG